MTDYEIRKIDRAIGNATTGIVAFENNNKETDMPMIAETENEFFARRQHYDDVQEGLDVLMLSKAERQQHEKMAQRHVDMLAACQLDYALQCRYEFDPIACAEQFSRECI